MGGSFCLKSLQSAAKEMKKFVQKVEAENQEQDDENDRESRMRGREPRKPDGKQIFANAERPVGKRFGDGVGSGARAGFCAV